MLLDMQHSSRSGPNVAAVLAASASLRDLNAALKKTSQDWSSPFEALKLAIQAYSSFTRRFPASYLIMLSKVDNGREGELASEVRRTVSTVACLVQAAQQAGELKDGDPDQLAALIVAEVFSHGDLDHSRKGLSVGKLPPLLLLELLAEKSRVRTPRHFEHFFGSLQTAR